MIILDFVQIKSKMNLFDLFFFVGGASVSIMFVQKVGSKT